MALTTHPAPTSTAVTEGATEITLEASDVEALASPEQRPLPDAFYVVAMVAAESDRAIAHGAFRLRRVQPEHAKPPAGR